MMYESVILDSFSNSEIYKLSLYADPESSETTLTESEDSTDNSEEVNENDDVTSSRSGSSENTDQNSEVSERTSGSDMPVDHTGNSSVLFSDRWDDTEEETDEGSHVGSNLDSGTESGDPEDGTYEITIRGDTEQIGELYRYLNGDDKDASDDFNYFESDGDQFEREISESDYEYDEYDPDEYSDGSGDSEGGSESGSYITEYDSDAYEFYLKNIELLGIIAGCLFFIVFTIICKYIYKFFRMFI